MSARWVSQSLTAHDRIGGWLYLEMLGSYTRDKELFLSLFGYWGQNVDLPLALVKQMRIHAVEGRGSPHIYTNL